MRDPIRTEADVQFRRLVDRLEIEARAETRRCDDDARVNARPFAEYTTQRGPTEVEEKASADAAGVAQKLIERACAARWIPTSGSRLAFRGRQLDPRFRRVSSGGSAGPTDPLGPVGRPVPPTPAPLPARKPRWLKVKAPGRAQLRALKSHDARAGAPHGVRGGPLPQHRRMLGAQGRHLHDPGRRLHPELHLLRRLPRHAQGLRSAGAGAPGGGGRADGAGSTW